MSHGAKIRDLRKSRGLTLSEVSEQTGLSKPYLSEIETGSKPGSFKALSTVAVALGVPVSDIFDPGDVDEQEMLLLETFRDLSAEDKKAVLRHAVALSREVELRRLFK